MLSGKAPKNYVPAPDAFCLMDLINILSSDEKNVYLPDTSSYKRIGKERKSSSNIFNATTSPVGRFEDLVLNESLLNIGIRFKLPGYINVESSDATILGSSTIDCFMYNTHSIIKDGTLNMETMNVVITNAAADIIKSLSPAVLTKIVDVGNDCVSATLLLKKIPVINRKYAKENDLEKLTETVYELNVNKAKQKATKTLITEEQKFSGDKYTPEQYKLLKEKYFIEKTMAYSPKVDEVISTGDYYDARSIDFDIAGWSSLPKIDDVVKKKTAGKELKVVDTIILEALNTTDPVVELTKIKEKIRNAAFWLSVAKLGKILTGTFWPGLIIDGDKYKHISKSGNELKVKLEYKRINL
jgi:hypothetical protein